MIASVQFKNFKALRAASVRLELFNLVLGPSGSGKTSLIEALLRLRALAGHPAIHVHELTNERPGGPRIEFRFLPPYQDVQVSLACTCPEPVCNLLVVDYPPGEPGERLWEELQARLRSVRAYLFDHYAMAAPAKRTDSAELASNAGNLAAVLADWREKQPAVYGALLAEFLRIMPEFSALDFRASGDGRIELQARLAEGGEFLAAEGLSQGMLYLLATLVLTHNPAPPAVVCLEEADRGVHPRLLREVRDALYRLAYPKDFSLDRAPVQVIATTHSPYLLDLFKDHPEEVLLGHKRGRAATFERLSERKDLLELMREAHLGDLWFSGILGGVPGEE